MNECCPVSLGKKLLNYELQLMSATGLMIGAVLDVVDPMFIVVFDLKWVVFWFVRLRVSRETPSCRL